MSSLHGISPEDQANLPAGMTLPQRSVGKVVEHTSTGSYADVSDLAEKAYQEYIPHLQMHGVRQSIRCEATESDDGHSGAATHLIRMPGERSDQIDAVCAVHHTRLMTSALEQGGYDVASRRIRPEDVGPHLLHRAKQTRVIRTTLEAPLYAKGLRGDDVLVNRKSEILGKGGGKRTTDIEELNTRRTAEESDDAVSAALARVRLHGGRHVSAAPTVDFNGEDLTLGDSYAKVANLRRKSEAPIPGARAGNTENYYMAGVQSPDGSSETTPTSTRRFNFNKAGVPNTRGGRKPNPIEKTPIAEVEASDVAPSNKGFLPGGKQRRALKVTMNQLPITPYPTATPGIQDDAPTIKFAKGTQKRSTDRAVKDIALNAEADRLRKIEAKRTEIDKGRNKAFKIDWNDVPRPE